MDAIRAENLTKTFAPAAAPAVDALTFTVAEGEVFGLVGPDGAGKTTVMRLLATLLDPTAGDAWIAGLHSVRDAEAIKDVIGYMSQRFGLYPDLSVLENIGFYADIYGVTGRDRVEKTERLLAFSRLAEFRRRPAGQLSGGMKQKLALVCALIHTPKILFLDEPTNGVDPVSRREFWHILEELAREGVTLFVSTAYLDEAERCSRLALLHKGRILDSGTPAAIKQRMPETVLELRTEDPRRAFRLLKEKLAHAFVNLFGDQLHVAAADPDRLLIQIREQLEAAGLTLNAAERLPPSLEDVFVSMLAREGEGGPHA